MMTERIYEGKLNEASTHHLEQIIENTMREQQVRIILESEEEMRTERIDPTASPPRSPAQKFRANTVAPTTTLLFAVPREKSTTTWNFRDKNKILPPDIVMQGPVDNSGIPDIDINKQMDPHDSPNNSPVIAPHGGPCSSSSSLGRAGEEEPRLNSPLVSPRPPHSPYQHSTNTQQINLILHQEHKNTTLNNIVNQIDISLSEEKKTALIQQSPNEFKLDPHQEIHEDNLGQEKESPDEDEDDPDDHDPMDESGPIPLLQEDTTVNFHSFKLLQKIGSGSFGKVFKVYIYIYIYR